MYHTKICCATSKNSLMKVYLLTKNAPNATQNATVGHKTIYGMITFVTHIWMERMFIQSSKCMKHFYVLTVPGTGKQQ